MSTEQICLSILQFPLYNLPRWDDQASGKTLPWLAPDFTVCQDTPHNRSFLSQSQSYLLKVLVHNPDSASQTQMISSSLWEPFKHLKMVSMTPGPSLE